MKSILEKVVFALRCIGLIVFLPFFIVALYAIAKEDQDTLAANDPANYT